MARPRFTLFHYPDCSKSRPAFDLLTARLPATDFQTIFYAQPDQISSACSTLPEALALLPRESLLDAIRQDELTDVERQELAKNATAAFVGELVSRDVAARLQRPLLVDWDQRRATVGRPFSNIEQMLP
ncbi:arsenate reductase [Phlyctochytrium arcticum]|nr:arsenate reductase [Phlyctochytrium arcticum]KAI9088479.1 arsenate reductase [Phlyctochytrium arcticum]KAI9101876.1 arsenate reductase [Phlyctochytrium arcticum]